jgi:hypothetical protein
VPTVLTLSTEATARRVEFQAAIEPRLGPHGDLYPLRDWGGKLVGAVIRVAALLHLAEHGSAGPPISALTLEKAIEIGGYYIEHAREVFALMGADPRIDDALYVSGTIMRKGWTSFTKRELFEIVKGRIKKTVGLDDVLNLLAEHGYVRRQVDPPHPGPGRKPSPRYEVNSYLFAHNSHNPQNGALLPSPVDVVSSPTSQNSQSSQNVAGGAIDHGSHSFAEPACELDLPAALIPPGEWQERQLPPEDLAALNAAIDAQVMERERKLARQAQARAAQEAALSRDRERVEAELSSVREQVAQRATTIGPDVEEPGASPATGIETKSTGGTRPQREPSRNAFADAVRIARAPGSISFSDVLAKMKRSGDDAVSPPSSRRTEHVSLPAERAVPPPSSAPPDAGRCELDEAAMEVARKCAAAAMKVHGVGPYARKA